MPHRHIHPYPWSERKSEATSSHTLATERADRGLKWLGKQLEPNSDVFFLYVLCFFTNLTSRQDNGYPSVPANAKRRGSHTFSMPTIPSLAPNARRRGIYIRMASERDGLEGTRYVFSLHSTL